MTNPDFRATPEQWETIEKYADRSDPYSCFLELRARIKALEAAQQPPQDKLDRLIAEVARIVAPAVKESLTGPAGSLVNRVDKPLGHEARAAILDMAAWLRTESEGHLGSGLHWVKRLEQEANQ